MKKVVLFGVSANPPTGLGGHQGIVQSLVNQEEYDEVWVMPVFNHIYSSKRGILLPFSHRVNMCRLCFERESSDRCVVKVSTVEEDVSRHFAESTEFRVGTIDILDYLLKQHHNIEFHLAVGLDTFLDLANKKWKESDRLLSSAKLIVYQRPGCSIEDRAFFEEVVRVYSVQCVNVPSLSDVSSSLIRDRIKSGNASFLDEEDIMCREVRDYVLEHNLYRD